MADERRYIEILIANELKGSPLEGQASNFVKYGDEFKVDPLLAIAIANHESNYCKAYAKWHNDKYKNCSGIMNGGQANGLVAYESYDDFVKDFMELLNLYVHKDGRTTISLIGSKYAPVASHSLNIHWVGAVTRKYHELWKTIEN